MNNKLTAEDFSAQIHELLGENRTQEAIALCDSVCERDDFDSEMKLAVMILRSYSLMAAGDVTSALAGHIDAFSRANELPAMDQFGIAEDALRVHMPYDYCSELFYQVATRLEEEGDPAMAAGAFNKAGICLFRHGASTGDEKMCFQRALEALERAEENSQSAERSDILTALIQSNLAECLVREGNGDQAMELYSQAAEVFEEHLGEEDTMCLTHYAICQRCLSDLYRGKDENVRAHACLSHSIMELEQRRNKLPDQLRLHLAVCYNARGTLRFQMGNYEGEVEDCTQSLLLREDLEDDPSALATVISNRAEAYAMLEQFDEARSDFIRAIEILDSIPGDPSAAVSAATRSYSLGLMCAEEKRFEEACDAFRSAADRLEFIRSEHYDDIDYTDGQLADIEALARMRLGAAIFRLEEMDYYEALKEGRKAIRLLEDLPTTPERAARLAALHISIGEVMETFDELEAAQAEYDIAEQYRAQIEQAMSDAAFDYGEENEYQDFEHEGSIWEDFSDGTPQG